MKVTAIGSDNSNTTPANTTKFAAFLAAGQGKPKLNKAKGEVQSGKAQEEKKDPPPSPPPSPLPSPAPSPQPAPKEQTLGGWIWTNIILPVITPEKNPPTSKVASSPQP